MKEFETKTRFAGAGARALFHLMFAAPMLKRAFHTGRGDKAVDVSEWFPAEDGSHRRMCFYTMIDAKSGEETRCLEVQQYSEAGDGDAWRATVRCAVTPENPMGNIFRIEAVYVIAEVSGAAGGGGAVVSVRAEVECNTSIWGLQGMAESVLYTQAKESVDGYLALARERLKTQEREGEGRAADGVRPVMVKADGHAPSSLRMRQQQSSDAQVPSAGPAGEDEVAIAVGAEECGADAPEKNAEVLPAEDEFSEKWCSCHPPVILFMLLFASLFMAYIMFSFAV